MEDKERTPEREKELNREQKPVRPPKKPHKGADGDFKRRYFDFYDDIKISDRQDW